MRRDIARILPVLVLVVFVFLLVGSYAAQQTADAGTGLWSVWPDRLVYRPGETARFKVVVRNDGDNPADVRVRCEVRSELDDTTPLFDMSATVGARDYEEMLGAWKAGDREYGYEVRAQLYVKGSLRETRREYFAVGQKRHLLLLGQSVTGQSITLRHPARLQRLQQLPRAPPHPASPRCPISLPPGTYTPSGSITCGSLLAGWHAWRRRTIILTTRCSSPTSR